MSIEQFIPDIREAKMEPVKAGAKAVITSFVTAVSSGNLVEARKWGSGQVPAGTDEAEIIKSMADIPEVRRIANLGVIKGIDITSVQEDEDNIRVEGTLNGIDGPVGFSATSLKDEMKFASLVINAKSP